MEWTAMELDFHVTKSVIYTVTICKTNLCIRPYARERSTFLTNFIIQFHLILHYYIITVY